MSALVGWFRTKEGQPISLAGVGLEAAEKFQKEAGKRNIRDQSGKSRLGIAFPLEQEIERIAANEYTKIMESPARRWVWLKGWLPEDLTIRDWFSNCGLDKVVARSCLAEITSHDEYFHFTAPVEVTRNLIGATVGAITSCVEDTPEIAQYVARNRQQHEEGDGIMLTRYLAQKSLEVGTDVATQRLSSLAFTVNCAFIDPTTQPEKLFLVRSKNLQNDEYKNRPPYLHVDDFEDGVVFATLSVQLLAIKRAAVPKALAESTVLTF